MCMRTVHCVWLAQAMMQDVSFVDGKNEANAIRARFFVRIWKERGMGKK